MLVPCQVGFQAHLPKVKYLPLDSGLNTFVVRKKAKYISAKSEKKGHLVWNSLFKYMTRYRFTEDTMQVMIKIFNGMY